jgi:Chalcone isomerase-like
MSHHFPIRRRLICQMAGLAAMAPPILAMAQSGVKPVQPVLVNKPPSELGAFGQGAPWQMQGTGALRFFGFKAYDANLWSSGSVKGNPLLDKSLFALEIVYNTSIKAEEIVNVSLVEMARLKKLSDVQIKTWTADMQRTFPNVTQGDRLTGVYVPKVGTRFFLNARLIAEINDPAFGDAFFAIWLDEGTKRAELRRSLLGLPATAAAQPGN